MKLRVPYLLLVPDYLLKEEDVGGLYSRQVDLAVLQEKSIDRLLVSELLLHFVDVDALQLWSVWIHEYPRV